MRTSRIEKGGITSFHEAIHTNSNLQERSLTRVFIAGSSKLIPHIHFYIYPYTLRNQATDTLGNIRPLFADVKTQSASNVVSATLEGQNSPLLPES